MNQPSTDSSISSRTEASAEGVSKRAYEIWEREGRPEGCDLRHWLQAEQELGANRSENARRPDAARESSRSGITDQRQSQPARPATTASTQQSPASRDPKRSTPTPFGGEKNGAASDNRQNAGKRKPAAAPVL